jgi:hypothetical protein
VAFFGVEDDDVLDHAALFQDNVDVLGTHARLGQLGQVAAPFFVQANGDHLSGMVWLFRRRDQVDDVNAFGDLYRCEPVFRRS